jgi:hypothetical protein
MANASSEATALSTDGVVSYRKVKARLEATMNIPLRLPTFVPFSGDPEHPVFAIPQTVSSENYEIQLAWSADCNGGNWCHLGSIEGSSKPFSIDGHRSSVSLHKGIKGSFVASTCDAYCSEARIYWSQDDHYYEVGIKAGHKAPLVKMANSAIGFNH